MRPTDENVTAAASTLQPADAQGAGAAKEHTVAMNLNPYLSFKGNAREAMEFYQAVLGGELTVSTFAEFGMAEGPQADQVMHSQLVIDGNAWLMGSDTPDGMGMPEPTPTNVALFGGPEDAETLRRQFDALAEGGHVLEPLVSAPWGDVFGIVADRFGTVWQINIGAAAE